MQVIAPVAKYSETNAAQETGASKAKLSQASLTENFDTFLKLLTAQLQNQDPLNPMDPTEFVGQLTQFSELEQSISQSRSLEDTVAALHEGATKQNIAYLGRTISVESQEIALGDDGAAFSYVVESPSENMVVRIFDSSDKLVAEVPAQAGVKSAALTWDGMTKDGVQAAKGAYYAELVSVSDKGASKAGTIILHDEVSEVRFEDGEARLVLKNGVTADAKSVIGAAFGTP